MFIIVGGIVCVTIYVMNHVNAYEDMNDRGFMIYMLNLAFESHGKHMAFHAKLSV